MPPRCGAESSEPARKSTRTATRVPPPPPLTKTKPPAPSKSKPTKAKKARSAAPADEQEDAQEDESEQEAVVNGTRKRKAAAPAAPPKVLKPRVPIQGINPLPTLWSTSPDFSVFTFPIPPSLVLPDALEKPRKVFVFGAGGLAGQHGLGTDAPDEIERPTVHTWFEEKIAESRIGSGVDDERGDEKDGMDVNGEAKDVESWKGGVAQLSCGGMHTLAIDSKGRVWSWGANDNAALGRVTSRPGVDSDELEFQPNLAEFSSKDPFSAVQVASGDSFSLAISDVGELRCWGNFKDAQGKGGFGYQAGSSVLQFTPIPRPPLDQHTITQIATGSNHFLALTSTGKVFTSGDCEQGQLGRIISHRNPLKVRPERLAFDNISRIGSGSYHSSIVNTEGLVYAFGLNSFGQCGIPLNDVNSSTIIPTPALVDSLSPANHNGAKVVQIEGGRHHSVFLFNDGTVWACGRCDAHECGLGEGHEEMKKVKGVREEIKENRRVWAASEKEKLIAEGMDEYEAFGVAELGASEKYPLPNPYIPQPNRLSFPPYKSIDPTTNQEVEEETKIVQIACGITHNFAVSLDGRVFGWGTGDTCQLGIAGETTVEVPREVRSVKLNGKGEVKGHRVLWASTGGQHSVVVAVEK